MSRLTTDVQEFKSSFKLVISQVSAPGSPSPHTPCHTIQFSHTGPVPPHPLGPKPGEGVGEGQGKFTEGRRQGSVQGQDKWFLSCSEILPPQKTFPRTQARAFPGPACQEQNHPGLPCPQNTWHADKHWGGGAVACPVSLREGLFSSTLLAPWLLGHGRQQPTAPTHDSVCSVCGAEREANWDLLGRLSCPQTLHLLPSCLLAQRGLFSPWLVRVSGLSASCE